MEIKSYLEKLDKEELIVIIYELNEKFPKIQNYLKSEISAKNNESTSSLFLDNPLIVNISRSSTPKEKIVLYRSLFVGREDVFALRWFNSKTDKSGSDSAFYDCSSLISITIPNSVTSIGGYAFCGCLSLTDITIGNSVTEISSNAFSKCTSLTTINYTGTKEQWSNINKGIIPSTCVINYNYKESIESNS